MIWSQLAELRTPPISTTDFIYLRFIGDRRIDEKNFGKIQKDRVMEMKKWAGKVKRTIKEGGRGRRKSINLAIASANNHYAGFGPGTANIFRKMVGLPEAEWSKEENKKEEDHKSHLHSSNSGNVQPHYNSSQSTLSDFIA